MNWRIRSYQLAQVLVFGILIGAGALAAASPAGRSTAENPQWPRHVIAEGYMNQTAIAADFTGDGKMDVISNGDGKTRLYVAPDWKEVIIDDSEERRGLIHSEVMDVDGDGDPDFIGAVYRRPIFWLERPDNPLKGPWAYHLIDDQVDGTHGLIAGDVNGDGRPDLIGNSAQPEGPFPNSLAWLEMPENPRQAKHWIRHIFADRDAPGLSHYLGVGDVNGDGRADLASAAKVPEGGNWFAWWEQPKSADGAWRKHVLNIAS